MPDIARATDPAPAPLGRSDDPRVWNPPEPERGADFTDARVAPAVPAPGDCPEGMCWAEPLKGACDHWQAETERLRDLRERDGRSINDLTCEVERLRLQVLALENAAMETAAQLGEAEHRIAVAVNYLTDESRDRITRIRLAELALEDKAVDS